MTDRTKPETPQGQPLGDTGDGDTGVPEFEQGISNRPGDRAVSHGPDDTDEDKRIESVDEVAGDDAE